MFHSTKELFDVEYVQLFTSHRERPIRRRRQLCVLSVHTSVCAVVKAVVYYSVTVTDLTRPRNAGRDSFHDVRRNKRSHVE